jgi:signal transduction histidine kinase
VTHVASHNEELLRRASSKLEDRNRELDAFAGRVAHGLRGPLSVVGLAGAQLAQHAPEADVSVKFQRGLARMESLIEDLLTLARIDDIRGRGAECDAVAVANSVRQELEPRIEREGGRLRVHAENANVWCTAGLLVQALIDLGDNAIKYRRPDVPLELEIRGRTQDGAYVYSLADNGLGMSGEDAAHVFEPFYRAERTRAVAGTGLGLAIVRRIVEAHGGSVAVESEPGRGTTFMLRLPLAPPKRPQTSTR